MTNLFPDDLFFYYSKNPTQFARRINWRKHTACYVIAALALLLMIFPILIPIKVVITRIIAFAALLYASLTISLGGREWCNIASGGRIIVIAIKHFARPMKNTPPGGSEDQRILNMFASRNWAALASEPSEKGNPLRLSIHEDAVGRTFYLQLGRCMEPGHLPDAASEVKTVSEQEYTLHYGVIKSIKPTR